MLIEPLNKLPDGKLKFIRDTLSENRERDILERLWARFEPYADANFKTAIASEFQSHFWEMYLAVTLLDLGFELHPRTELGDKGPDICISSAETNIWIEAIACGISPNDDAESENESEPVDEQVILRYTSAIAEKFRQYREYLNTGILSSSEPYLIAINGSRVPFSLPVDNSYDKIPDIIKAVMPYGDYTEVVDRDTMKTLKTGYSYRAEIVKPSGNKVATNIFLSQEYAGISAILFSNIDISNLPDKDGNDLLFFRNPTAINPLPIGWLKAGCEYRLEGNKFFKKRWQWVNSGIQ